MTTHFTLTDVAEGAWLADFALSPRQTHKHPQAAQWFPGNDKWSVSRRVLRGGLSDGVEVVDVDNGQLAFSILPTRGMGVWRGTCGGLTLGWQSPVQQPVNPAFVNQADRGGLGWLSGFNELICRCGLDSNGPPGTDRIVNNMGQVVETQLTLHGKIANIPAHKLEVEIVPASSPAAKGAASSPPLTKGGQGGVIRVTGEVDEAMLFGPALRLRATYETVPGSNQFTLIDEITNLRDVPGELMLLYHTNWGGPFLEGQARLIAPVKEVAPCNARAAEGIGEYHVYAPPTPGFVEQCYVFDLAADRDHETAVMLRNAHGDKGVSLHFNKQQLPCFTIWKSTMKEADGYVTGLEPATNYPNPKTLERERGRVIVLKGGETYRTRLDVRIHATPDEVAAVERHIGELQRPHQPVVQPQPVAKYTRL